MNFREWLNESLYRITLDEWVQAVMQAGWHNFSNEDWLVMADWFEEQGDPMADLIRNFVRYHQTGDEQFWRAADQAAKSDPLLKEMWDKRLQIGGTLDKWSFRRVNHDPWTMIFSDLTTRSSNFPPFFRYIISPDNAYFFKAVNFEEKDLRGEDNYYVNLFDINDKPVADHIPYGGNYEYFINRFGDQLKIPLYQVPPEILEFIIIKHL